MAQCYQGPTCKSDGHLFNPGGVCVMCGATKAEPTRSDPHTHDFGAVRCSCGETAQMLIARCFDTMREQAEAYSEQVAHTNFVREEYQRRLKEIRGLLVVRPHRFADQTEKIHEVIDRALLHAEPWHRSAPVAPPQAAQTKEGDA